MTEHPFFSVVVPVYNRAELLEKTLPSVLRQSFRDFEVIVVNDGSTDNTNEVLTRFASADSRIRIINQENKERGAARNTGMKNASGEYVVFFDSDDYMNDNHLEVLHKNITALGHPSLVATKFDFIDENGIHSPSDITKIKGGQYDYRIFLSGNPLACNICIKKNNSDLINFIEDRRYSIKEDWLFLLVNTFKHKLYLIDEVTISMSDHPNRSMRSDNNELIRKTLLAHEWILNNLTLTQIEKNILYTHICYFCGIHSYLENKNGIAIDYALKAIRSGGIKLKYVTLLLKSIAGRKIISRIK